MNAIVKQYILYINLTDSFHQFLLPNEDDRSLKLEISEMVGIPDCFLKLECFDSAWNALSGDGVVLFENDTPAMSVALREARAVYGVLKATGRKFSLLLDAFSKEHVCFDKFLIGGMRQVTVGKENAALCLKSDYISREHALLTCEGGQWFICDRGRNGIYINSRGIPQGKNVPLRLFDDIYTGGFRMFFLGDLLAINHASWVSTSLMRYGAMSQSLSQALPEREHTAFLRSPRRFVQPPSERIEVEGPPQKQTLRKQPLLFVLGPALTTPLPMLTTMLIRMNLSSSSSSASMYWVMGVSVLMSAMIGLGWTLARRRYDQRENRRTEEERVSAYQEYLKKNERLLQEKSDDCRKLLLQQNPSSDELESLLLQNRLNEFLWNRNTRYEDFSSVRIGIGQIPLPGDIVVPKERFSINGDPLAEEPAKLREQYRLLQGIPSLVSLKSCRLLGILGEQEQINGIVNNMVVQLTSQHSYSDVRLAFFYDRTESAEYDWVRWLPHVFSADRQRRYIGCGEESCNNTLSALMELLRVRAENASERENRFSPLFVVFCTQPSLFYNSAIYSYITSAVDLGIVFVLAYGRMDLLPNECRYLIQADNANQSFYALDQPVSEENSVRLETVKTQNANRVARELSRFWIHENASGEMPVRVDFLEMYGLSDVRNWALLKHWRENRAYENIRARIGSTYGGQPVYLDIHEKMHGPHGLVAGTTGSGKSETIQTFILSLLLNYSPDEVAFILIDYKGGGMSNLFAGTPHIAGTITNLGTSEGSGSLQTQRALVSLRSELKYRQSLFAQHGVNHIDAYNRLRRAGKAKEPLPHLIIISDEFAELKHEQPDFIKELVSTARVGRSLGVHLILATQKPSGVVDQEIWSNARFKLCLKVQDKTDSMEMLKRPEASELTRTGQGYLQIGNNESFLMFQSGYSGAVYRPDVDLEEQRSSAVEFIRLDGTSIRSAAHTEQEGCSQLEACVQYIRQVTEASHVASARQLWLPLLSSNIPLESLLSAFPADGRYNATIGRLDCPQQQLQPLFTIAFPECGHILIGGNTGSGKSSLMRTILCSLCSTLRPEEMIWYAADFSGHAFASLREDDHCGGIVYPGDKERMERLFQLLFNELRARKKELAEADVSSAAEYRARNLGNMPLILLLLDNYAGFTEEGDSYAETFQKLLRDGVTCGIHVVTSVTNLSDMSGRLRQLFTFMLPLTFNERSDYSEFLGGSTPITSTGCPGSGVIRFGEDIVQY